MTKPDSGSPDSSANQDDAVWLDLVARLEGTPSAPDEGGKGKPGSGTGFRDFDPLGLAPSAPPEASAAERLAAASTADPASGGDSRADDAAPGPRDYVADDDGDRFVPEDPPSLAGTDPLTMLAWLGAVGGPVALLLSAMFWRSAPLLAILGIVAVFVLAVVYLIMKLPQEKDENDDGARV
jgi:hypothetical protein